MNRDSLNKCFVFSPSSLSTGDLALLNCTAIVNTSNETLTDKNPISESIHRHAGPELRDELLKLKGRGVPLRPCPGSARPASPLTPVLLCVMERFKLRAGLGAETVQSGCPDEPTGLGVKGLYVHCLHNCRFCMWMGTRLKCRACSKY